MFSTPLQFVILQSLPKQYPMLFVTDSLNHQEILLSVEKKHRGRKKYRQVRGTERQRGVEGRRNEKGMDKRNKLLSFKPFYI